MKGINNDYFELIYSEGNKDRSEIVHTFPDCCDRYVRLVREGKLPVVYLTTNHILHPHD